MCHLVFGLIQVCGHPFLYGRLVYLLSQYFIASSDVLLSTNSIVFETSTSEKCTSISVADNDNVEGSRSYQLLLERNGASTVPVELYPSNIHIIVIDSDSPGIHSISVNCKFIL